MTMSVPVTCADTQFPAGLSRHWTSVYEKSGARMGDQRMPMVDMPACTTMSVGAGGAYESSVETVLNCGEASLRLPAMSTA
jgi:hypothetical protein